MNQYDDFVLTLLEKAEDYKFGGQHQKAIEVLQKLILSNPECLEAYEELGDNFLSIRELKKSEKALRHALKLNPKSPNVYYLLGFLYSLDQKWGKSVLELEKADKLFPNNPEILRCLGWSFYNENRTNQGIAVLERSKTLAPNDLNILCDLGVCYMNSENFEAAKSVFQEIIKIDPKSDQAFDAVEFLDMLKKGPKRIEIDFLKLKNEPKGKGRSNK